MWHFFIICLISTNFLKKTPKKLKCELLSKYAQLHNRYKSATRKISQKNPQYMLNYSLPCNCNQKLNPFWFIIKQQWKIEEIYIFSNSSHLEWSRELSGTILKGDNPSTIPDKLNFSFFGLICFSSLRGEDLNVKIYNVPWTEGKTTDAKWCQKITWPLKILS